MLNIAAERMCFKVVGHYSPEPHPTAKEGSSRVVTVTNLNHGRGSVSVKYRQSIKEIHYDRH